MSDGRRFVRFGDANHHPVLNSDGDRFDSPARSAVQLDVFLSFTDRGERLISILRSRREHLKPQVRDSRNGGGRNCVPSASAASMETECSEAVQPNQSVHLVFGRDLFDSGRRLRGRSGGACGCRLLSGQLDCEPLSERPCHKITIGLADLTGPQACLGEVDYSLDGDHGHTGHSRAGLAAGGCLPRLRLETRLPRRPKTNAGSRSTRRPSQSARE